MWEKLHFLHSCTYGVVMCIWRKGKQKQVQKLSHKTNNVYAPLYLRNFSKVSFTFLRKCSAAHEAGIFGAKEPLPSFLCVVPGHILTPRLGGTRIARGRGMTVLALNAANQVGVVIETFDRLVAEPPPLSVRPPVWRWFAKLDGETMRIQSAVRRLLKRPIFDRSSALQYAYGRSSVLPCASIASAPFFRTSPHGIFT